MSEQYVAKLAKLSARQKLFSCKQYVVSIRASIPLHNVEDIVRYAADRALTEEKIIELCCDAYINEIGNTYSGPQNIRSIFNLNYIKSELKKKTIESIKESLGSEIRAEIKKHIKLRLESKLQLDKILDAINLAIGILLASIVIVIAEVLISFAIIAVVASGLVTLSSSGQNVNSRSWREGVAKEIYKDLSDNRYKILKEISTHLRRSFNATNEHLKTIAENLEDFIRRIDLID